MCSTYSLSCFAANANTFTSNREEREQQEADERVDALKKRLLAIRAARKTTEGAGDKNIPSGVKPLNGQDGQAGKDGIAVPQDQEISTRRRRIRGLRKGT